ncbi:hypothetical protein V2J09_020003 [Rumex salicifolius]
MAVGDVKKKVRMRSSCHGRDHRYLLFLFVVLSFVNLSSCQNDSPRNIETVFPFIISPPPPPPIDPPPPSDQPATPQSPDDPPPPAGSPEVVRVVPAPPNEPPGSPSSSSKKGIVTAVAATAASAFVLAAVFFLLFTRLSKKRRREVTSVDDEGSEGRPVVVAAAESRSEFKRFDGNVKGYVVDEDGLDVLYWNKLNDSTGDFRQEPINTANRNGGREPYDTANNNGFGNGKTATGPRQRSSGTANSGDGGGQLKPSEAFPPAQQLTLMAVPTLPAPPPPPPPAPKNIAPMPPPPPPPASKFAVPPPRPPPGGSKTQESAAGANASGSDSDQVKLKPLHWEKVNINHEHSNVWEKIERGSFQYNGDMMEALFGVAAAKRKPSNEENSTSNGDESSNNSARIFILDQRKSQNVAIVIKTLGIPHDELIESLLQGKGLSAETLEKLTRTSPTEEEASKILAFNGDPSKLAYAEFFLYSLLRSVPSAFTRANQMLFRFNYASEILNLKESLQTLESACNDLRNRGIFLKLLEAILKAGNRLNAGTARGNAKAFNLTTLRKLSDYKSSDGKTTLLHFVIHEVVRNEGKRCVLMRSSSSIGRHSAAGSSPKQDDPAAMEEREKEYLKLGLPVVGGLSSEFSSVKKAANIDYDVLKSTLGSLATRIECELVDNSGSVVNGSGGFMKEMKDFLELAKMEVKEVEVEHTRVMDLVKKTTNYYQARASSDNNPLQLFVIVKDFLGMVDQACVEIARSSQQKKQTKPESGSRSRSGSFNSGGARNRVTFPRLPKNFMSDKSSSSSDDDS